MTKLLEEDYQRIVDRCFSLPDHDIQSYYENTFDEYFESNPDLNKRLIRLIDKWIQWYKREVRKDGPVWEVSDQGEKVHLNDQTLLPNPKGYWSFRSHVDLGFFELQKKILDLIILDRTIKRLSQSVPESMSKGRKRTKELIQFKEIFTSRYRTIEKIDNLKKRLRIAGIINSTDQWRTDSPVNEITVLYYYLSDNGVISNKGSKQDRIIVLYQEFGKTVAEKANPGVDTTRVNAIKKVYSHPFTSEIDGILKEWISK